jgi:NADH dehydrogenase FAD-containing subunit
MILDYKTKGMMALIGQRNGVGILFGRRVHEFTAWWLWRSYYLGNLPTLEKKLRVAGHFAVEDCLEEISNKIVCSYSVLITRIAKVLIRE